MRQKFLLFIIGFVIFSGIFITNSQANAESITNYDIDIRLYEDASIQVQETIKYDFGNQQRHGIFRDIPVNYDTDKGQRTLKVTDITVHDSAGLAYKFDTDEQDNDLRIKIGDADTMVTGQKSYVITYTVKGAINFFDEYDEFYWNAVGGTWDVPIRNAKATVTTPRLLGQDEIRHRCFAGAAGSTNNCLNSTLAGSMDHKPLVDTVTFIQELLNPHENLTIVVGVPKGVIHQPTPEELAAEARAERSALVKRLLPGLVIPVVVLSIMLIVWFRWGRDPQGRGTIVTQFDVPDQLTPMEVGTLMDEKADQKDVSASIIYLATKGYLKVKRIEERKLFFKSEDYMLQQIGGMSSADLPDPERRLYTALFDRDDATKLTVHNKPGEVIAEVKVSDLTREFYGDYQDIQKLVTNGLVSKGYFDTNPQYTRLYYLFGAIAFGAIGFLFKDLLGPAAIVGCMIGGGIIFFFSFFMPQKTSKGVLAKEHLLGLKDYLKVAEADRIKFHNAPNKDPKLFEKFLPYAMVFGVEKEWAKQFENIYMQPPGWYSDPTMSSFNSLIFLNSLSSFSASANSAIATAPSGGSGFSGGGAGGGFGGGGGGSW